MYVDRPLNRATQPFPLYFWPTYLLSYLEGQGFLNRVSGVRFTSGPLF
jgi:hypothetical protein